MRDKKKLLFIMDTFPLGGISKSLLALLNELDCSKYEIDMLLMRQEGIFVPMIPSISSFSILKVIFWFAQNSLTV